MDMTKQNTSNSAGQLQSIVERIEDLEAQKKDLGEMVKDILREAKSAGFDIPALRALLKYRAEDASKREERQALLESYLAALGQLGDTPLGRAAVAQEGF
jgi:uncharacterized protein (UPF0335 family)